MTILFKPQPSNAQLFPFPTTDKYTWSNRYILMRAGLTLKEEQGILETNPLFLTSRVSGNTLSQTGASQILQSCDSLTLTPTIIKHPLSAACIDTANLVAGRFKIGRDRVVPEFTFMDGRGAGLWNGLTRVDTTNALLALDRNKETPPSTTDGTPSEDLLTVSIRLRQLLSVLETQYGGENILLVLPDEVMGGVLLESMVGGDVGKSWIASMEHGETWVDIGNTERASIILNDEKRLERYEERLRLGMVQLEELRRREREEGIVNLDEIQDVKDMEETRILVENAKIRDEEERIALLREQNRRREEAERRKREREEERIMKRKEILEGRLKKQEEDRIRREEKEIIMAKEKSRSPSPPPPPPSTTTPLKTQGEALKRLDMAHVSTAIAVGVWGVLAVGNMEGGEEGEDGFVMSTDGEEERKRLMEKERIAKEEKEKEKEMEMILKEEEEAARVEELKAKEVEERKKFEEWKAKKEEREREEREREMERQKEKQKQEKEKMKSKLEKALTGEDDGFEDFADGLLSLMGDDEE